MSGLFCIIHTRHDQVPVGGLNIELRSCELDFEAGSAPELPLKLLELELDLDESVREINKKKYSHVTSRFY